MKIVNLEIFKKDILTDSGKSLIYFNAPWSGLCNLLTPVIINLERRYGNTLLVYDSDVSKDHTLAKEFKLKGVPALYYFSDSEAIDSIIGNLPENSLISWLSEIEAI